MKNHFVINLDEKKIIFDFIKNGILITNQDSIICYTNPAFTGITGYTKEEVGGQNPGMLHSGRHDVNFYKSMWQNIVDNGFWEGEIWNRRKSGEIYPEFLTISKINQAGTDDFFYIAIFSDITFLKKDISKKLHLAFYDPLTELPNRNLYLDRVNKAMARVANKPEKGVVIFYMDLDRFKKVNDTHGHCVGDKLLNMVGKRLLTITRESDTIARIGGDEFAAIVTSDCDKKFVVDFAKRIVNSIEKPFSIDGHQIDISISIGISFYPHDADNLDSLLAAADKAMYLAKKSGTRIECFDNSL